MVNKMSKEFIVNEHRLAKVECGMPLRHCPVYYKILLDKAEKGELTWSQNCDYNPDIVLNIKTLSTVKNLKSEIMNLCMDCDSNAR